MKLSNLALVLGHAGPGRPMALAALTRAFGADQVTAALARGMRRSKRWPVLEVGSASRIRAAAYACYVDAPLHGSLSAASALGLSEYAYFGRDSFEPYRVLGAPLPAPFPGPQPDFARPWVVLEGIAPATASGHLSAVALRDVQLHTLVPGSAPFAGLSADVVRWLDFPATTASVLGRSYAVIASDGPLLWDAIRLDRNAIPTEHVDVHARDLRLAATLPPILLGDRHTLKALVEAGPEGFERFVIDLDRMRDAIERRVDEPLEEQLDFERARRRFRKLQSEPQRFLNESRSPVLRRAGKLLERSGLLGRWRSG